MTIDFVSRWLHVWFAGVVIGGAAFQAFAFGPFIKMLSDEQRLLLRERVNSRWSKVVALTILVMLATGLYNYLVVMRPLHKGDGNYHMLMGAKILLSLPVFFLASALAGRSAKMERFRRNSMLYTYLLIALVAVIVGIGSYLKVMKPASVVAPATARSLDV